MSDISNKLIVALDVDGLDIAEGLIDKLYPLVSVFKVGSPLFTKYGPCAIEMVHKKGAKVFLDLKFHDIPNTVASASRFATGLGVFMFNVHAQGGLFMMAEAKKASVKEADRLGAARPVILAVTVLTSMADKDLEALGVKNCAKDQVVHLAKLAKDAGLDGVVASVNELNLIRPACGDDFVVVTPGIRPSWASINDQKRIATPKEALESTANYIVVGRPIIEDKDPIDAARRVIEEMKGQ